MNEPYLAATPDRVQLSEIVLSSLKEILSIANDNSPDLESIGEETSLIGQGTVLDSLGLVNLIVDIEQRLEEKFDITVVLADERAMSQKRSPFRTVSTLTDYIYREVEDKATDVQR